jgi:hypothetical protein
MTLPARLASASAVSLALAAKLALAQGGPPLITDDTATPRAGQWEVNIAATAAHGRWGTAAELPLIDISFGLTDHVQVSYAVPLLVAQANGESSRSAVGNSSLGLKWRFYETAEAWRMSVHPQVELRTPGSNASAHGLAGEGVTVLLPLQFEHALGEFGFNFEVGRALNSLEEDDWYGGVALGRELRAEFELMAELHSEHDQSLNHSLLALNLGARVGVGSAGTLLISLGRELHNDLGGRAHFFGYLGWQVLSE